jgi:hypothetical protein
MHRRFAADTRRSLFANPWSTRGNHEALLVPWVVAGAVVGASASEKLRSTCFSLPEKGQTWDRSRFRVEDVEVALTFTPQNQCTPFLALLDILEGITTWEATRDLLNMQKCKRKYDRRKQIAKGSDAQLSRRTTWFGLSSTREAENVFIV